MSDRTGSDNVRDDGPHGDDAKSRREFLKKVAKGASTAPAVALLLAASHKPAAAAGEYDGGGGCACGGH